jgi:hypothetical protein
MEKLDAVFFANEQLKFISLGNWNDRLDGIAAVP